MRTEVRQILPDPDSLKFSSNIINAWLDYAYIELMTRLEFDTATATVTTTTGQSNYQLPDNILAIKEIYIVASDGKEYRLEVLEQDEINSKYGIGWRSESNGRPTTAYKVDYNVLGIFPPPDAANASRTLTIFYFKPPTGFTADTETPPFTTGMHQALVYYGVARGCFMLGNDDKGIKFMKLYEVEYNKIKYFVQNFSLDELRFR